MYRRGREILNERDSKSKGMVMEVIVFEWGRSNSKNSFSFFCLDLLNSHELSLLLKSEV